MLLDTSAATMSLVDMHWFIDLFNTRKRIDVNVKPYSGGENRESSSQLLNSLKSVCESESSTSADDVTASLQPFPWKKKATKESNWYKKVTHHHPQEPQQQH